jgi:mono/diheme cytochrome c family protein
MYRRAIRTLFVAAALLLTTTACDSGGDAKKPDTKKAAADDGAKADDGGVKADDGGAAEAGADSGTPVAAEAGGEAGAGETGAAAVAETGGEDVAAGETGAAAVAEDDGGKEEPVKPPPDKPEPEKPEPVAKVNGKPIFEAKCKSCHGIDGKGDTTIGKKVDIPSLSKTSLSKSKIVSVVESGVPDTKMKAYKDKLSKEEIDAVAAYVKKL